MEILKLYEQSKALNAAQVGAVNHDSGISSAPSSAGESVSSTDTNHGGSDEDLIDFNQSWRHSRYDNWPPGKTSYILHSFEHSECLFPGEKWWSRDGAVLRAPASYQFGPRLKPDVHAICCLSLFLVCSRSFSLHIKFIVLCLEGPQ